MPDEIDHKIYLLTYDALALLIYKLKETFLKIFDDREKLQLSNLYFFITISLK